MYESQRKQRNLVINNGIELSNEDNEISAETANEEIETQSENDIVASKVIQIVEYVSIS